MNVRVCGPTPYGDREASDHLDRLTQRQHEGRALGVRMVAYKRTSARRQRLPRAARETKSIRCRRSRPWPTPMWPWSRPTASSGDVALSCRGQDGGATSGHALRPRRRARIANARSRCFHRFVRRNWITASSAKTIRANGPSYDRPIIEAWRPNAPQRPPQVIDLTERTELKIAKPLTALN